MRCSTFRLPRKTRQFRDALDPIPVRPALTLLRTIRNK
jgi:hypothetical protein